MDIIEFFKKNTVDEDFDEIFYENQHPELHNFYLQATLAHNISNRERLWFHYVMYGEKLGLQKNGGKSIYLKPQHGLGNRLLQLDSAYAFAIQNGFKNIYICWSDSAGFCTKNASFSELFDYQTLNARGIYAIDEKVYEAASIKHMILSNFIYQDKDTLQYVCDQSAKDFFGVDLTDVKKHLYEYIKNNNFCLETFASLDWMLNIELTHRYELLSNYVQPSDKLQKEIDKYQINPEYIGLHIRGGDALISPWSHNYKQSTQRHYELICEKYDKIFLSTDSIKQQKYFQSKYPHVKFIRKNFVSEQITTYDIKNLQFDAAIDMFLLSKTSKIYGTNWSTFSDVASKLGSITKTTITPENMEQTCLDKQEYSAVVAIKNRFNVLKTTIHSWLLKSEIAEFVIVDYDSNDIDIEYLKNLDNRIKIITIKNQPYFDLSKAYNIAIKNAKYSNIIKLDVDYFLSPYISLSDWLTYDLDKVFVTGNWKDKVKDNNLGFLSYLNGFIVCKKEYFLKAGCYLGNKDGYGYDDCSLYERLEKLCHINRVNIDITSNNIPIFHVPHNNYYRSENYKNKNIEKSIITNSTKQKKWEWIYDYFS